MSESIWVIVIEDRYKDRMWVSLVFNKVEMMGALIPICSSNGRIMMVVDLWFEYLGLNVDLKRQMIEEIIAARDARIQ